jgi:hypothetical protein
MGDRAEMSCATITISGVSSYESRCCQHTNDLRYESKLSREMLKGSFSASRLRWFDEVVETLDLECQKLGFSCCGDGWRKCQPRSRRWTIRGPLMRPHACI